MRIVVGALRRRRFHWAVELATWSRGEAVDEPVHSSKTSACVATAHARADRVSTARLAMETIDDESVSLAGTTCAIVTVLRALLDGQPDQDAMRERLHAEYVKAAAQYDANPSLAGEHRSFEEVFDMLGLHLREAATGEGSVARGHGHHAGNPTPDSATTRLTDGVDDASLY